MPKKRRLGDLYVTGKEVTLNDNSGGDPITVWVQKLNPIEYENAARRSSIARAKFLAARGDQDSEIWQSAWSDLHEFAPAREQLLFHALREDLGKKQLVISEETAADEKWAKDDYLQGLYDAWNGTTSLVDEPAEPPDEDAEEPTAHNMDGETEPLRITFLRGEDHPGFAEAKAVMDKIAEFEAEVEAKFQAEKAHMYAEWDDAPIEKIREMATNAMIESTANNALLDEFQIQELFYAVRTKEDHSVRYFQHRDEVAGLQPPIRRQLIDEFRLISVDPLEGKGSPGTPGSLLLSGLSEQEATPTSSGPGE